MRVIGLTGGIASGKSTVSGMLKRRGIKVIDADVVARQVVLPGSSLLEQLADEFGGDILFPDGSLDRKRLGRMVFQDESKLQRLNGIMLPAIRMGIERELEQLKQQGIQLCVLDAAILIESGLVDLVDQVILVQVEPEQQLRRLMQRDQCNEEEARARIRSQMSISEKKKFADWVIDNGSSLAETEQRLDEILRDMEAAHE